MGTITDPVNIEYLALEGGGGKGITFLGAIKALEELGVLPLRLRPPSAGGGRTISTQSENKIKGVGGASAGAITALFLALGYSHDDIRIEVANAPTFEGFFDPPSPGRYRAVDGSNNPIEKNNGSNRIRREIPSLLRDQLSFAASFFWATDVLRGRLTGPLAPHYLENLMLDRGIFPGFPVRTFLRGSIQRKLGARYGNISFRDFFTRTGVELVLTGTNITRHTPGIFSVRHTPNFPVAEAVGISMNLPFLFKPVEVEANVPVDASLDQLETDYLGFWVDGGLLNNFPLHAFDHKQTSNKNMLHPKMLGLRLTDGTPPGIIPRSRLHSRNRIILDHYVNTFKDNVSDIFHSFTYPSEGGQIRNADEREQTIDLYTYDLQTANFSPQLTERNGLRAVQPILKARESVHKYFGFPLPSSPPNSVPDVPDRFYQPSTRPVFNFP
jgi:NTE family protein